MASGSPTVFWQRLAYHVAALLHSRRSAWPAASSRAARMLRLTARSHRADRKLLLGSGAMFSPHQIQEWPYGGKRRGTNDRYIAESREFFGEGFLHWAAGYPNCNDRSEAVVYYRNKCVKNEHPSRRCPLNTVNRRVLRFADIREILLHYYATGERSPAYAWDDISAKYQEPNPTSGDDPIKEIRPAWDRIHQAGEWP